MCTAMSFKNGNHYFGRNLDVEFSFCEQVAITPKNKLFKLKCGGEFKSKYSMIGIAAVINDYPLYYEATNSAGLSVAGLNFPDNAKYHQPKNRVKNITPFEFIPWTLGQASSVKEAEELFFNLNLVDIPFSEKMPLSPLHFMISDKERTIVLEPTEQGIQIYKNPFCVMTNNPPFPYHAYNMNNYLNLSAENGENRFSKQLPLKNYGVGMGALGLPGDTSSSSRFVRCAFNLANSHNNKTENENVSQFFHILDSVAMLKGSTLTDSGKQDITLYSCCINTDLGIFYYKTYDNNRITAIKLNSFDFENDDKKDKSIITFPLRKNQDIFYEN